MMEDKYIHMNIRVSGSVQGVGFRYAAMRAAVKMGIRGFVRNLPDGDVYIEAEGEKNSMDKFISWCRKGPPYAWVEHVEVSEKRWEDFAAGFDIRI
jgi:acylphosphatase